MISRRFKFASAGVCFKAARCFYPFQYLHHHDVNERKRYDDSKANKRLIRCWINLFREVLSATDQDGRMINVDLLN